MRKAPTIFLLVISLLWHTFAMTHVGLQYDHGDGAAHVALHLEKEPHHHHDDGTFHQDDSDESVQHVYADACASTAGFVPTHSPTIARDGCAVAGASAAPTAHDSPILEGPRRPPRTSA
jgi:hypothetical protein